MAVAFLLFSSTCFISCFGIHSIIENDDYWDKPLYTTKPFLASIPWICGFVFPVIPFCLIFQQNWFATFILNATLVYFAGPILTKGILVRFASGKGLGRDMFNSLIWGLVFLIIGAVIR